MTEFEIVVVVGAVMVVLAIAVIAYASGGDHEEWYP